MLPSASISSLVYLPVLSSEIGKSASTLTLTLPRFIASSNAPPMSSKYCTHCSFLMKGRPRKGRSFCVKGGPCSWIVGGEAEEQVK